jgi:ribosomal protein L11 methyltransferase
VIDPGQAFGTGAHPTTRLCLELLLGLAPASVVDLGCGSGVLAIAAVTLGARSALGIDIDPDALDNARENAELNHTGDRVRFDRLDFRDVALRADIVLANLTGALIERSAATLAAIVEPHGRLIVSGFMEGERDSVARALERFLGAGTIDQEDEWMCGVFKRS